MARLTTTLAIRRRRRKTTSPPVNRGPKPAPSARCDLLARRFSPGGGLESSARPPQIIPPQGRPDFAGTTSSSLDIVLFMFYGACMDWNFAIERWRVPLIGHVLGLFAKIGLAEGVTIERVSKPALSGGARHIADGGIGRAAAHRRRGARHRGGAQAQASGIDRSLKSHARAPPSPSKEAQTPPIIQIVRPAQALSPSLQKDAPWT